MLTKSTLRSWRPTPSLLGQRRIIETFRANTSLRSRCPWHTNLSSFSLPSINARKTKLARLPFDSLDPSRTDLARFASFASRSVSANLTFPALVSVVSVLSLGLKNMSYESKIIGQI